MMNNQLWYQVIVDALNLTGVKESRICLFFIHSTQLGFNKRLLSAKNNKTSCVALVICVGGQLFPPVSRKCLINNKKGAFVLLTFHVNTGFYF